jgi:hypothetical protein
MQIGLKVIGQILGALHIVVRERIHVGRVAHIEKPDTKAVVIESSSGGRKDGARASR